MRPFMTEALEAIADRFHPREGIKAIRSLGSGNVNETFLVTHEGQGRSLRHATPEHKCVRSA
jgi:hypothetical protein